METTTMIMLFVGLSCEGETARMCRVFADPAASRGTPALSSTPVPSPASGHRTTNALRDEAPRASATETNEETNRPEAAARR
ncbi:MAG: hypothetical protein HS104_24365 [Polyangiaceae bacterium]|nr:hypothetical protein [Polyangiaceae bacterium]MCL4756631.1 hypothetical protein [Myxococcales bacterium]